MKLPKGFSKMSDIDRREWVYTEKKKKERELDELTKLSRELASNTFKLLDYERPDLLSMKDEES
jgi:hypothetical protein